MQENNTYRAGLYLRLSKDDDIDGESISIGTQCKRYNKTRPLKAGTL